MGANGALDQVVALLLGGNLGCRAVVTQTHGPSPGHEVELSNEMHALISLDPSLFALGIIL
jgi:hypothetical protein